MAKANLCESCVSSRWCATWAERKCVKRGLRFTAYGHFQPAECPDYKKRDKNFKEPRCQCEDCLQNESLLDELDEESEG